MLAPLLDFNVLSVEANWYLRVFDPGQHLRAVDEVAALCAGNEALARALLATAWSERQFISGYAQWTIEILEQQRHYHYRSRASSMPCGTACTSEHRVVRAYRGRGLLHLLVHTLWLSLVTTFFPALGASLHGALAQSEAYRLETHRSAWWPICRVPSTAFVPRSPGGIGGR